VSFTGRLMMSMLTRGFPEMWGKTRVLVEAPIERALPTKTLCIYALYFLKDWPELNQAQSSGRENLRAAKTLDLLVICSN
jgi:hypothetical protein